MNSNPTFEDFKKLARDDSLTQYEKIGFPNRYREGLEELIFADILRKVPRLSEPDIRIIDIGCGCSGLPRLLTSHAKRMGQQLYLLDSEEMLSHFPEASHVTKVIGPFPDAPRNFVEDHSGYFDVVLAYSFFPPAFLETNIITFADNGLRLLGSGGEFFIGDVPNISKRLRFMRSEAGAIYHRELTGQDGPPPIPSTGMQENSIDDAMIICMMTRARLAGFEAYVLPQPRELFMSNRREDFYARRL